MLEQINHPNDIKKNRKKRLPAFSQRDSEISADECQQNRRPPGF